MCSCPLSLPNRASQRFDFLRCHRRLVRACLSRLVSCASSHEEVSGVPVSLGRTPRLLHIRAMHTEVNLRMILDQVEERSQLLRKPSTKAARGTSRLESNDRSSVMLRPQGTGLKSLLAFPRLMSCLSHLSHMECGTSVTACGVEQSAKARAHAWKRATGKKLLLSDDI